MTTNITLANIDWEIVDDVKDALKGATYQGKRFFSQVNISTSEAQVADCQQKGDMPAAFILYEGTNEVTTPDDVMSNVVTLSLRLVNKIIPKPNEADRLKEVLRMVNACKNAVEADPPANASAWGDENNWHRKLNWGDPDIAPTEAEKAPWVIADITLEVGFVLEDSTSH